MWRSAMLGVVFVTLMATSVLPAAGADQNGTTGLSDLSIECRVVPNRVGQWSQVCWNDPASIGPWIADIRVPGTEALNYSYQWTWNGVPPTSVFNGCTAAHRSCAVNVRSPGEYVARAVVTDPNTGATRVLEAVVFIELGMSLGG